MTKVRIPLFPTSVRWILAFGLAAVIFYLSVLTAPPAQPVAPKPDPLPLDKWRHFLAYGALANALAYATADWDRPSWQLMGLIIGATILYGVGIEAAQALVPYRYFSVLDAYANALGALFAIPWFLIRSRIEMVDLF
ncbi:VanZ family protein [Natronomonas halophila]|uniref:VanZ family protein n=1 Tax=Natronomonas halophila TaxID=2747817 RepID=UPI0015B3A77F|nr:VanZ family protein [Natronomonas halophila]QLD86955.1 VanZ family protein [Natronomonas halophila]